MFKRNAVLKLGVLVIVALMLASIPGVSMAHDPSHDSVVPLTEIAISGPIKTPAAGMGGLVFINYNGGSEQLNITLQGKEYKVAPEANGAPSFGQIDLAPGTYDYTANVANVGDVTASVDVVAGKVIGLGFVGADPEVVVHNSSREGSDASAHTFLTLKNTKLIVYEGDMTPQVTP